MDFSPKGTSILSLIGDNFVIWDDRHTLEQFLNEKLNPTGAYYDEHNWLYEWSIFFSKRLYFLMKKINSYDLQR